MALAIWTERRRGDSDTAGKTAGEAEFDVVSVPHFGTFDIGQAHTTRVSPAYEMPFKFTGTLESVGVELK